MRLNLDRVAGLRAVAAGSFAFALIFVGLQVYLPQLLHGDQLPPTTGKQDVDAAALLVYVHSHAAYFSTGYVLTALNFLFLLAPISGAFLVLRRGIDHVVTGVTLLGAASSLGVAVSQVVASRQWLDWADKYRAAATTGARLQAVHGFENGAGVAQIGYLLADTGLALWLALLGLLLLRREGRRSVAAWATLAAGLLYVTQFPVLPVWALGAAISFWRTSDSMVVPPAAASQSQTTGDPLAAGRPESAHTRRRAPGAQRPVRRRRRR